MGSLISMCLSSSKVNTNVLMKDSSTSSPQPGQHISIQTFRELNQHLMSRPTWRKTETSLILENFKSIPVPPGEVNNLPMIPMPRFSTQTLSPRPSIYSEKSSPKTSCSSSTRYVQT
uniref:AC4 protein n=1 Tax=Dalechampia chlorotic mosaic virus TaxID=1227356 RepID=J9QSI6_9GEMI|nr:AC4 protein [Dalechampia chlorotic mosaic virus]